MQLKKLMAAGLAQVVVGTHALLEDDVEFKKLGLAIVDEQHRFGVDAARQKLMEKGVASGCAGDDRDAHSAHAGADVYGDLDVRVIDEMPPGPQAHRDPARHRRSRRAGVQLPEEADRRRAAGVRGVRPRRPRLAGGGVAPSAGRTVDLPSLQRGEIRDPELSAALRKLELTVRRKPTASFMATTSA